MSLRHPLFPFLLRVTCLVTVAFAATVAPASVPSRVPHAGLRRFVGAGLFEGGDPRPAVLSSLDVTLLPREAVERWTVSFAGEGAPRFRLRYEAAETYLKDDGNPAIRRAARFIVVLRNLRRNLVTRSLLDELVQRSRFVSEIRLYPPLEDGDTALELVLRQPVLFEPYQPAGRDGRLVLDLVSAGRE